LYPEEQNLRTDRPSIGKWESFFFCNKTKINCHSTPRTATGCSRLYNPASASIIHTSEGEREREGEEEREKERERKR